MKSLNMTGVEITCDRCKETIISIKTDGFTVGFYVRSGTWGKYMNDDEEFICDNCMWADERYMADFPMRRKK